MTKLHEHLVAKTAPLASEHNIIKGKGYRITVLTERLLRVEKQRKNIFTDDATQNIWNRNFPDVNYTVEEEGNLLLITTAWAKYYFDPMSQTVTQVFLDGRWVGVKNGGNLGGTCRTLDNSTGRVRIGDGLLSKKGVSFIEDKGLLLVDGEVKPRKAKEKDIYIFAYGRNYRDAIKDYFFMTGEVPFLPRYVFGNWWSRYHAYTQKEYLDLMTKFEEEKLPFTVATVDMDWHWVNVNQHFSAKEYGHYGLLRGGWSGYSWNTELFPDHQEFLKTLHEKNLRVTLNLHPAQGVRCFEKAYPEMATAMGIDPKSKKTVRFDCTDPKFINAYFDILHHPMEEEGVDFWWIDWQQGKNTKMKGLDPLWSLNHYHYLDSMRGGKRGVILSRYSGIGAHRYPLGFSGDTFARWSCLAFQPEFTATASNIGYGWWSHDIGGHTMGFTDDEMYIRWCQLGAFSPINRLHSSTNELQAKEPWKHSETSRRIVSDYLRLRHALIPYIYNQNYLSHTEGSFLCEPMYYSYPHEKQAYKVPKQYMFGTELLISPIVTKVDKRIGMARTDVWLPKGYYTDVFTGKRYKGDRKITIFRDPEFFPVFAKQGAIIPLSSDEGNECENPTNLKVCIYRGNNEYTLYEDDGLTQNYKQGKFVTTKFSVQEKSKKVTFTIQPPEGDESVLPKKRKYILCFKDIKGGNVYINGKEQAFTDEIVVPLSLGKIEIVIDKFVPKENGDPIENAKIVMSRYQKGNHKKLLYYLPFLKAKTPKQFLAEVKRNILFPKVVREATIEQLTMLDFDE